MLEGIGPAAGEGLEFAPSSPQAPRRPDARLFTVHRPEADRHRVQHGALAGVGDMDIAWGNGTLRDAVDAALPGPSRWFGYAIASHGIEHVPDVIWWLAEIRSVLSSGGTLRLAISDRRFTTDIARRETGMADVLAAYLAGARRPQPRDIIEHYSKAQAVDVAAAWQGRQKLRHMYSLEQATLAIRCAQSAIDGGYHDVRCCVFTPRSFVALMVDLARLGMVWFAFAKIYPTAENAAEFTVHLEAADDRQEVEESWRHAVDVLAAYEVDMPALPQDEPERLRVQVDRLERRVGELEAQITARRSPRGVFAGLLGVGKDVNQR